MDSTDVRLADARDEIALLIGEAGAHTLEEKASAFDVIVAALTVMLGENGPLGADVDTSTPGLSREELLREIGRIGERLQAGIDDAATDRQELLEDLQDQLANLTDPSGPDR